MSDREEFEKAMANVECPTISDRNRFDMCRDRYEAYSVEFAWLAWQAARAQGDAEPVACPYHCGWQGLQSIITQRAAYFATASMDIDEPVPPRIREAGIELSQYAITLCSWGRKQQSQPAAKVPEYVGWYCEHCQRGVDGSEVTYHEQHEVCGRVITNDEPPAHQPEWIACSEREATGGYYLAFRPDAPLDNKVATIQYDSYMGTWSGQFKVTHYRNIPEPPQPQEGDHAKS